MFGIFHFYNEERDLDHKVGNRIFPKQRNDKLNKKKKKKKKKKKERHVPLDSSFESDIWW